MSTFPFCLLPRIHLLFLSICLLLCCLYPSVWLFFTLLPLVASVSSGLKKSFPSSSHLFLSLPTPLSESSAKETSLSWSQSVSVLLPSCVSLSEFSWLSFLFFLNVAFLIFMLFAIFFFCTFFWFVQLVEASSVLFMVSFLFVCQGPCSARVAHCRREHRI